MENGNYFLESAVSFDERKSRLNQIWDLLTFSINFNSNPGRGIEDIDESKTDYLQLFILSTDWQRQKFKR